MDDDLLRVFIAFSTYVTVMIGLLALAFSLSLGFKKIAEIENIIGPQGSTIDIQKRAWGASTRMCLGNCDVGSLFQWEFSGSPF